MNPTFTLKFTLEKDDTFGFVLNMSGRASKRKSIVLVQRRPYRKGKQRGGFLNRYDFAYAGRDTVNHLGKIAPGLIKDASSQISSITQ